MSKEVEQVLNVLAERFGTTVEMLWAVLIKQQFIEAMINVVYMTFLLILTIVVIYAWVRIVKSYFGLKKKANSPRHYDFGDYLYDVHPLFVVLFALCNAFVIAFFIFLPYYITTTIGLLLNPEYYALQEILKMF